MPSSIELAAFELAYVLSPIFLTNGLATTIPGNMLPLAALLQPANFALDQANLVSPLDQNAAFGHFRPLPGYELLSNDIGDYPFANQAVAANAIISNRRVLSMRMDCPANQPGSYLAKLATITAMRSALAQHANLGGTYTVATPSGIETNLILLHVVDVSRPDTQQVQNAFQFDFVKVLLTQEQATTALGSLLSKIDGGLPTASTAWSGVLAGAI